MENIENSEKILEVAEPIKEVAEETTDVEETPQEELGENVELTDTDTEEQDESNEEPDKEKGTVEKTPKSDENAKFAQIRRKAEEDAKQKFEKEKEKIFEQAKIEVYKDKVNPYTGKPIKDLADIEIYELMTKLEEEGKDPISDLPDEMARKKREEVTELQKNKEMQEKTQQEIDEFNQKYPTVDLRNLMNDSIFKDYIQGKNKSITELYESFNNFKTAFRNSAVGVAKQTIANSKATPGALGSETEVLIDYENMSSEEFEKHILAVKNGEEK